MTCLPLLFYFSLILPDKSATKNMLTYTTHLKKLIMPEYGRNIQRMVDHCLTIEDRAERTRCAATIVRTMETLFPSNSKAEDYRRKLWDHLAIMSDFRLDVDTDFDLIRPESFDETPDPICFGHVSAKYRHYGAYLEKMIERVAAFEEGEERTNLILLLANHMKKLMLAVNKDGVEDEKIFNDLSVLSHGAIRIAPDELKLHEFKVIAAPTTGKKKKKK